MILRRQAFIPLAVQNKPVIGLAGQDPILCGCGLGGVGIGNLLEVRLP